ncbi:hypothetical protein HDU79_002316 [Rhizoclosmatium sp. JEL0117]|nr:hypothetical protein HDU79_002316 [Rhizoclosmatium sp. JEL0117]
MSPVPKAASAAGPTSPAAQYSDEGYDPEGGGGFAMDFGDDGYDNSNINNYGSYSETTSQQQQQQQQQQLSDSYANDPWFSSDSYATNSYVPEDTLEASEGADTVPASYSNSDYPTSNSASLAQHQQQQQQQQLKSPSVKAISLKSPKPGPTVSTTHTPSQKQSSVNGANVHHQPLVGTVGHPMFGSNVTLNPSADNQPVFDQDHNQLPSPHTVGFGTSDMDTTDVDANGTATHTETYIETNLVASFKWAIENFASITDEKLVSPPFGSSDHRWQIVVYPRGPANSDNSHLSGFLRPLKSQAEEDAGEDWFRAVKKFTIRVHKPNERPSYGQSEEVEESYSYTLSPSHPLVDQIPDDVLVQDTSLESDFNGFGAATPGWGFTTLAPLDLIYSEGLDSETGTLTVSASVESLPSVPWVTQTFSWAIPTIQDHLDSNTPTFASPVFGSTPAHQWTIHLTPDYTSNTLSAYLQPQLSSQEQGNWTRSISSFTLKIQSPQSEFGYTHSPSHVSSKTLTGGYIFSAQNMSTGWPGFLSLDQVPGCVDSTGTMRVDVEVTWIQQISGSTTTTTTNTDPNNGVSQEEIARLEAEWDAKVQALVHEAEQMRGQISGLETAVVEAKEETSRESDFVSELQEELAAVKEELGNVRDEVAQLGSQEEKIKVVKARLAVLRASFENGVGFESVTEKDLLNEDVDAEEGESKVGLRVLYTELEKETGFYVLKAKCSMLEADKASLRELVRDLRIKNQELKGTGGRTSPTLHRRMSFVSEAGADGPVRVEEVLENSREEADTARQTLDEFYQRGEYSSDMAAQVAEKAACLADLTSKLFLKLIAVVEPILIVLYAELSLSRAAVMDSCHFHDIQSFPTNDPNSAVSNMVYEIEQLMIEVDAQISYLKPATYQQQNFDYQSQQTGNDGSLTINTQQPQLDSQQSLDLQLQLQHYKTLSETYAAELANKNRIEELKAQNPYDIANSPAFVSSALSSPGAMKGMLKYGSAGSVSAAKGRGDMYPEAWTPVEKQGGPVSAEELAKMLTTLQTKALGPFTFFLPTILLLASMFASYATLHVHCPANPNTILCQASVPIYDSIANAWHTAATKFVTDVVPFTTNQLSSATASTLHVIDATNKKVKKDWERAERERLIKQVREQEKKELERLLKEQEKEHELEKAARVAAVEKELTEQIRAANEAKKKEMEAMKLEFEKWKEEELQRQRKEFREQEEAKSKAENDKWMQDVKVADVNHATLKDEEATEKKEVEKATKAAAVAAASVEVTVSVESVKTVPDVTKSTVVESASTVPVPTPAVVVEEVVKSKPSVVPVVPKIPVVPPVVPPATSKKTVPVPPVAPPTTKKTVKEEEKIVKKEEEVKAKSDEAAVSVESTKSVVESAQTVSASATTTKSVFESVPISSTSSKSVAEAVTTSTTTTVAESPVSTTTTTTTKSSVESVSTSTLSTSTTSTKSVVEPVQTVSPSATKTESTVVAETSTSAKAAIPVTTPTVIEGPVNSKSSTLPVEPIVPVAPLPPVNLPTTPESKKSVPVPPIAPVAAKKSTTAPSPPIATPAVTEQPVVSEIPVETEEPAVAETQSIIEKEGTATVPKEKPSETAEMNDDKIEDQLKTVVEEKPETVVEDIATNVTEK